MGVVAGVIAGALLCSFMIILLIYIKCPSAKNSYPALIFQRLYSIMFRFGATDFPPRLECDLARQISTDSMLPAYYTGMRPSVTSTLPSGQAEEVPWPIQSLVKQNGIETNAIGCDNSIFMHDDSFYSEVIAPGTLIGRTMRPLPVEPRPGQPDSLGDTCAANVHIYHEADEWELPRPLTSDPPSAPMPARRNAARNERGA